MDIFTLAATIGINLDAYEAGINRARDLFSGLESLLERGLTLAIRTTWEFGKDVVKTGAEFDQQMSAVQAVLGKEEGTVENMQHLREQALDTAEDSVFTAKETAQAYYYMGMAGWKAEQMTAGLPGIISLAAASGEDLATVSDIVTDSLTAFGLSADYAQQYADILAQTATNSNTDVRRMGNTFKYVAPIAGQLGVSVEDVALSIGLMANAGIKSSMAGTALRQILTRITTNAGATSKTLGALEIMTDKLGVTVFDTSGKMRDWSDIMTDARKAWGKLSPADQMYYAKQIASLRGMPGWLAMMNTSQEDWDKLSDSLSNASGAAETMANVRLDNLLGDTIKFGAALDVMKIAIYDDVKGPMREVVQDGTESIKRITDAINEDGLTGGIEQLGTEIENVSKKWAPALEGLGKSIGPILSGLLESVGPQLIAGAVELGASLGSGLIQGISDELSKSDNPILKFFGDLTDTNKWSGSNDWLLNTLGNLFGFDHGNNSIINDGVTRTGGGGSTEGNGGGRGQSVIGGHQWLIDELMGSGGGVASGGAGRHTVEELESAVDSASDKVDKLAETVGTTAGDVDDMGKDVDDIESSVAKLGTDIDSTASEASSSMSSNLQTGISTGGSTGADSLKTSLVQAGEEAASQIESSLRSAIANGMIYPGIGRTTTHDSGGSGGGRVRRNARAMQRGYVFDSPTIFGYAEGSYQMAGDAGPEAVIGTNSLENMVYNAAENAVTPPMQEISEMMNNVLDEIRNMDIKVVMDTGALVGSISREINKQLGSMAAWRRGGRA